MKLNVETGKFWSLKDTKNYKNNKYIDINSKVVRTYIFSTSFLVEIKDSCETKYVIPTSYMSDNFPRGFYTGICNNQKIYFYDVDVVSVIKND